MTQTTAWALKGSEEVNVSSDQETTQVTQVTQRWVVDPARSTVEFRVGNWWGPTTVVGHFSRFDGSYTVGLGGRAIELIVEAESLETGNRRRNKHLRSSYFFDVESHPHVRFTADDVTDGDEGTLHVRGELEAAGRKARLLLDAAVREFGDELEVEATSLVDQRLLGMAFSPLGALRSPSNLQVKARLTPTGRSSDGRGDLGSRRLH
jgi:polyisoprenoid-binding protein YceI